MQCSGGSVRYNLRLRRSLFVVNSYGSLMKHASPHNHRGIGLALSRSSALTQPTDSRQKSSQQTRSDRPVGKTSASICCCLTDGFVSGTLEKVVLPMLGHVDSGHRSAGLIYNPKIPRRYDYRFEGKEEKDQQQ